MHHPLAQLALEDGEVAALAAPVGGDLLVGQHGPQTGAPVDRCLRQVGEPVRVDDLAPLDVVQPGPVAPARRRTLPGLELRHQLGDRPRPADALVVPGIEDLQEDPLCPAVEGGVHGGDPAPLVVRQAQLTDLLPVPHDVGLGGAARVRAGLHGVLLRRQPERVEAHRVQHVVPGHPVEAAVDVGGDEPQRVPDVQARAGGIGEHVEHVQLGPDGGLVGRGWAVHAVHADRAGQGAGGVRGIEGPLPLPAVLPVLLDPRGQDRGVAVRYVDTRTDARRRPLLRGLAHRLPVLPAVTAPDPAPGPCPRTWKDPSHRRGRRAENRSGQRGPIRSRTARMGPRVAQCPHPGPRRLGWIGVRRTGAGHVAGTSPRRLDR